MISMQDKKTALETSIYFALFSFLTQFLPRYKELTISSSRETKKVAAKSFLD